MKMVTALLVLGLLAAGCATEQWSQSTRDIFVKECIADMQEEMEDDSQVGDTYEKSELAPMMRVAARSKTWKRNTAKSTSSRT